MERLEADWISTTQGEGTRVLNRRSVGMSLGSRLGFGTHQYNVVLSQELSNYLGLKSSRPRCVVMKYIL